MFDPIATEQRYRDLLHTISHPMSRRNRFRAIAAFLMGIRPDAAIAESYVVELAERLTQIIPTLNLDGSDPEEMHRIIELLAGMKAELPEVSKVEGFSECMTRLRHAVTRLFLYAGELESAIRVLSADKTLVVSPKVWEVFGDARVPLQRRTSAAIEQLTHEGNRYAADLRSIVERPTETHTPRELSVIVPVVERPLASDGSATPEGSLRRLSLKLLGKAPGTRDEIHADVSVFGAEVTAAALFHAPVGAARSCLAVDHPALAKLHVEARVVFHDEHALHEGSSANLALAALVYCSVLRLAGERNQFVLPENLAICGAVADSGEVLPVDAAGIPFKATAAFFSPVEFLVVPKQQLSLAELVLAGLRQRYPLRNLGVIGVAHLRELFFDRRLAGRVRTPLPRYVGQQVWRHRRPVAGIVFLAIIWVFAVPPLDRNPVGYRFEGEMLYLLNQKDQVVDQVLVGASTVGEGLNRPDDVIVSLLDLNNDGKNEIIWAERNHHDRHSWVKCKSAGKENLMWSYSPNRELSFAYSSDVTGNEFFVREIIAGTFIKGRGPMVIVNAVHNAFPGLIILLDAQTGMEISHYLHSGHVLDVKATDLNGDGDAEILVCGINNAYRSAFVAVLDPLRVNGHSPLTSDYIVNGYEPATERAYVLIPPSIVGGTFGARSKNNAAYSISLTPESHGFFLYLDDYRLLDPRQEELGKVTLFPTFGYDLCVKSVLTGDDYDILYDDLE